MEVKFTPTYDLSLTEDELWEVRRALRIYNDWAATRQAEVAADDRATYVTKRIMALTIADKIDDLLPEY